MRKWAKKENSQSTTKGRLNKNNWWLLIVLPVWTYAAFWMAQLIVLGLVWVLSRVGVPLGSVNEVLLNATGSVVVYVLAVILVVSLPLYVRRRRTTLKEMGVTDWPSWWDVVITPAAFIVYTICSAVFLTVVTKLIAIDIHQPQALPFSQSMLGTQWQYIAAFMTIAVLAPVAEELLFRGYLYGKLRRTAPVWMAVLITSLTFGAAHLWGGSGSLQWAVAADTFVLSIVMSLAREYTGAIWVPVLMHIAKNSIAFYALYVNPNLLEQLKSALLPLIGGI